MAREDYRSRSNETAMLAAFNTRMQDIANTPKLILGSEDGNALTTQGWCLLMVWKQSALAGQTKR